MHRKCYDAALSSLFLGFAASVIGQIAGLSPRPGTLADPEPKRREGIFVIPQARRGD